MVLNMRWMGSTSRLRLGQKPSFNPYKCLTGWLLSHESRADNTSKSLEQDASSLSVAPDPRCYGFGVVAARNLRLYPMNSRNQASRLTA
jgi:hypothetical protein